MSQIQTVLRKLRDTKEAEILEEMEAAFKNVTLKQAIWYRKSEFTCQKACGECCRNFEPDLLECEALYMAAWLMENKPEVAAAVAEGNFPFPKNKGCRFWDENNPYHCTIYGGRAFICRLFGACGNKSKNNKMVFKPCKFYPEQALASFKVPLAHRQYEEQEIQEIFGTLPPVMSDLMEAAVSISPDNHDTQLIHDILPDTIRKLQWICNMNDDGNDNDTNNGGDQPEPLAS